MSLPYPTFQSPDIVEIIAFPLDDLNDGDELMIKVDTEQITIY